MKTYHFDAFYMATGALGTSGDLVYDEVEIEANDPVAAARTAASLFAVYHGLQGAYIHAHQHPEIGAQALMSGEGFQVTLVEELSPVAEAMRDQGDRTGTCLPFDLGLAELPEDFTSSEADQASEVRYAN
ncbi:MAG: hypothetical protein RhofKO_29230 [Rhodothermales bacterium]